MIQESRAKIITQKDTSQRCGICTRKSDVVFNYHTCRDAKAASPWLQSEAILSPSGQGRASFRRRRGIRDKLIVQGTLNEKTGYSAISNSLIKQGG